MLPSHYFFLQCFSIGDASRAHYVIFLCSPINKQIYTKHGESEQLVFFLLGYMGNMLQSGYSFNMKMEFFRAFPPKPKLNMAAILLGH